MTKTKIVIGMRVLFDMLGLGFLLICSFHYCIFLFCTLMNIPIVGLSWFYFAVMLFSACYGTYSLIALKKYVDKDCIIKEKKIHERVT
jgi:hypothetical protein